MSVISQFVSSALEAVSLSPGTLRWDIYTVREEREGGKEQEGRKKRRDAVCLRDCPNKKIFPEFCICHLLLEGISEHVWDGLCAVCLALCAGMEERPQVNTGAFVPVLFIGFYAQAFSHWLL